MSFTKGALLLFFACFIAQSSFAQDKQPALAKTAGTRVEFSGLVYMDYAYTLSTPDEDAEGENGFGYRRVYLTTDYKITDNFSGRVRFEANDGSTTAQGRPAPFVKDLYVRWQQNGHQIYMGISSPPAFTVAEGFYGYRSLEKTILDRLKVVSSRDFGVVARGPLNAEGKVRYGVMLANNSSVKAETDKHKRAYGQLEFYPTDQLTFTLGGDIASLGGDLDNSTNLNAFAGFDGGNFRIGGEGFYLNIKDNAGETASLMGISLYAAASLNEKTEAIVRFDRADRSVPELDTYQTYLLAGVAVRPHKQVRFIPNIVVLKESEESDATVTGRVTLHVDF